MRKLLSACNTPLVMLATGIAIYILASTYFRGVPIFYGPDSEDILAPLFFDISRSIHHYGLLAGMYNPGQVAGLSLWNTPYFHPLYPFYFNWLGSDTNIFDTAARLKLIDLLHLAIYGSGCYLLCRVLGVRQYLSVVVALCSPWLPALQSMLNWPQILASFAWIPWVIGCYLMLYQRTSLRVRITAILGLSITFSLLVYAQPAQNMVFAIVGPGIIWIYMAISSIRSHQRSEWEAFVQVTASLAIAGVLTVIFCGEYLWDVVIFLGKSIRWVGADRTIIGHRNMPLSSFREYSLSLRDAADLITYTRSHIGLVGNLYVGAPIAFCAALLYAANKRDTKLTALFVSVMIAFLFCLYLFAPILRWIPIANKVREVNWWSCYLVALTIPLGALGLQWILDLNSTDMSTKIFGRKPIQLSVVALVATLVVALIAKTGTPIREALMICAGFSLLIAGLAWPARTRPFHQTMASAIVIICTLIPVLSYGRYSPSGTLLVRQDHVQTRYEAEQIAAATSDSDKFRFAVSAKLNNFRDFIATLSNLDLRCVGGNISPQEYDKFRLLFFPSPVVADLYGVKYQVISHGDHQPGDIAIDPAISLHVNAQALPRLFFVQGGMQITASPVEALLAIKDDSPLHFFVEAKDIPPHLDFSPYTKGDSVISLPVVSDSSPVAVKASLLVKGAGLLVLNEDPAGRWNATIDGRVVTPIRINGFQTAFPVLEAGQHDFEITRPTHLY